MTKLESLANELLFELFEFLDGVELFHGFYGLNSRFDNLLLKSSLPYRFDCQSACKTNFPSFCQKYLPLITNQVISLCLTDEDNTSQQTDLFISNHFSLHQFTHLKSLTLYHIRSIEIFNKITADCSGLTHLALKYLKLRCHSDYVPIDLNNIWNLPKLIYLQLIVNLYGKISFLSLTVTSLTLEYLILKEFSYTQRELASLLVHTPCLRRLHIPEGYFHDSDLLSNVPVITKLQCFFLYTSYHNTMLLQRMPNLCHLTVDAKRNSFADGYKWEQIIINYLPKLKVFRFKMHFKYLDDREVRVNELLNSFRSPFWIDEHQWFVRCHWDPEGDSKFIFLYTIPYGFHYFPFNNTVIKYKSTCPDDDEYNSYDRVYQLYCNAHVSRDFSKFEIRFPNIRNLYIELPINNRFQSILPTFDKVSSLHVISRDDNSKSQLLALLNRTSCLNSLQLQLLYMSNRRYFSAGFYSIKINSEDDSKQCCDTLNHSRINFDYEARKVMVKNHSDMLNLVNSIINLTRPSSSAEEVDLGDFIAYFE